MLRKVYSRESFSCIKRNLFTVIPQQNIAFREFLGGNRTKLEPGFYFNLPFFHRIKRVDMRETGCTYKVARAYTKDNVPVAITATVFHKVEDPNKVSYEVANYLDAIEQVSVSAIRATTGKYHYDQITSDRNEMNNALIELIDKSVKHWGINLTRFEINKFEPENEKTMEQLERQMKAERERRENQLNTQAKINTSEGEKTSAILKSEGERRATENKADAHKYAIDAETTAVANQLGVLTSLLGSPERAGAFFF